MSTYLGETLRSEPYCYLTGNYLICGNKINIRKIVYNIWDIDMEISNYYDMKIQKQ